MLDVMAHHLGQGILNNNVVLEQINKALKIAKEFNPQLSKILIEKNFEGQHASAVSISL
jgi:hypothetical protein